MQPPKKLKIVLVTPEIPQNTGNIGRFCLATGCSLDLVHPLGFELSEKTLRRAGLDYWKHLDCKEYASWDDWLTQNPESNPAYLSKKASKTLADIDCNKIDTLVFGCESAGLPSRILEKQPGSCFKIPIWDERVRSYNLANSVAMTAMHIRLQQTTVNRS